MPGTQPMRVSGNTMSIEPQPRSITASGGKIMVRMAWRQDMGVKLENALAYVLVFPLQLQ